MDMEDNEKAMRPHLLFTHGFFEMHSRLPNKTIKANCLACERMGKKNLIHATERSSSNLLTHLNVIQNLFK